MEENNYYPYGLKHKNYNMSQKSYIKNGGGGVTLDPVCSTCTVPFKYNYKYNGKEYQDELGLNMYDYGARNYDPSLGRWMNIDPLAEKHYKNNPYMYANSNPVLFIDPDGRDFSLSGKAAQDFWGKYVNTRNERDGYDKEEPFDDIRVNSKGVITNIFRNGKPNRFFNQKGVEMKYNDPKEMDKHMIYGHFNEGDKIFNAIDNLYSRILNAGLISPNVTGSFKVSADYIKLAFKSYGSWDFPSILSKEFGVSADEQNKAAYFGGSRDYFTFGDHNVIYNLYDAGQFMWGKAADHSLFSLPSLLNGVNIYENIMSGFTNGDSAADTQAITNGYYYQYFNNKVKGWDD